MSELTDLRDKCDRIKIVCENYHYGGYESTYDAIADIESILGIFEGDRP